jgi:DNA/RNA-binding domain of Phe-tRNA-synthetase-like protein
LREPVWIDVSREGDQQFQMNGAAKAIRAGDMVMRDAQGISCSILYGQDNRSPISPGTSHVLYVSYAPVGVPTEAVEAQLRQIEEHIRLFAPRAVTEQLRLLSTGR